VATNVLDVVGLGATIGADILAHRTWAWYHKGGVTVNIGGDTLVAGASTLGGFYIRELFLSTLIDGL
jgi:hypothetical protein